MKKSKSLQFLERAEKDPKIHARVVAAMERGGKVTAEEVLQIANEFGFKFTQSQFEKDAKHRIIERFSAGDLSARTGTKPPTTKPKEPPPPLSSCGSGCLSWTVNYCPKIR